MHTAMDVSFAQVMSILFNFKALTLELHTMRTRIGYGSNGSPVAIHPVDAGPGRRSNTNNHRRTSILSDTTNLLTICLLCSSRLDGRFKSS
jgi:hypothetical protein